MMVRGRRHGKRRRRELLSAWRTYGLVVLAMIFGLRMYSTRVKVRPYECKDIDLPSISQNKLCMISLEPNDSPLLPDDLCSSYSYPNLGILFASKNKFTLVPQVLGSCPTLQMVSFKSNQITTIHPNAFKPQLRWLILTDNKIKQLPTTIGNAKALQKLMLSGNQLSSLPTQISECTNLELIRLASNQLTEPPMDLLQLPKLAWIALSGNPFLAGIAEMVPSSLTILKDDILETGGIVVGEGTSGIARKVAWNGKTVAVKTYKGTITSDGSPLEERHINVVVASINHESLVRVYGQTPNGSLVMEFLEGYTPFGQPPSMDSCSRDVYPDEQDLTPKQANMMVTNLLEVLAELHKHGITHGDFYGHNILVKENSVKLSDFGASFFYDKDAPYGEYIQKIEMRAFGHLVKEIEMLLGRREAVNPLRKSLKLLHAACFDMLNFGELDTYWASL
eukprot:CAMPEP_0119019284 /NCGR_PEP_ID=MMETSP1176-20130426/21427_1 /TAXON_ID=265551 /ORGANISM="Synedropsis recta cf, Strain CCMP1620" /LENGTH=449 /DNA_ID=CAMNT_0006973447 /DNA_START=98 /DNA_END=1444 /DNA_ORIENTATION=-